MVNTQLQSEGKKTPNTETETNNSPPLKLINPDYSIHLLFVPSSSKSKLLFQEKTQATEGKDDKQRSASLVSCKVLTAKWESLAKRRQTELRT